jgi:hypothetical protein
MEPYAPFPGMRSCAAHCGRRGKGVGLRIVDQKVLDLSAYGKFVDNFSQDFSSVVVSLGAQSITVCAEIMLKQ